MTQEIYFLVSILAISNQNSFRVLLIKLLPYILFEKYIYILEWKWPAKGTCTVSIVSAQLYLAKDTHSSSMPAILQFSSKGVGRFENESDVRGALHS